MFPAAPPAAAISPADLRPGLDLARLLADATRTDGHPAFGEHILPTLNGRPAGVLARSSSQRRSASWPTSSWRGPRSTSTAATRGRSPSTPRPASSSSTVVVGSIAHAGTRPPRRGQQGERRSGDREDSLAVREVHPLSAVTNSRHSAVTDLLKDRLRLPFGPCGHTWLGRRHRGAAPGSGRAVGPRPRRWLRWLPGRSRWRWRR